MEFTFQTLLRAGEGGYTEYRIPGAVGWKNSLVLCCEARASSYDDWGRIDLLILGEEGVRHRFVPCGAPDAPNQTAALVPGDTLNNPTLIADGEKLHLIYHVNYRCAFHAVSRDGGRTWEDHREITSAFREFDFDWNVCATGPGHGIRLQSGRLLAPVWMAHGEVEDGTGYRVKHYPSVAGAIYSDDGGETWHAGAIFRDQGELLDANETTCAELPDGRVLFNLRHRGARRARALALSPDGGESFDRLYFEDTLPDPMCFGSMAARDGEVYFSNCAAQRGRVDLTVRRCAGGTWKTESLLDAVGGYSDLAVAGGKLCAFYERTVNGAIPELILAKER